MIHRSDGKHSVPAVFVVTLLVLMSVPVLGQSFASISGTVTDHIGGILPGAEVTAINTTTGVEVKTRADNAGVYNFPMLQPGVYRLIAKVSGFRTTTQKDVLLGIGSQLRLSIKLMVAPGECLDADVCDFILGISSSTKTVLQEHAVTEFPSVANDALELVNIMGGVVKSESPIFDRNSQTFAGVSGNNINISRDGISVNEIRYASGISSPARLNPELVGEFKMVLSSVDAEMGHGAGQVQMTTRSGSNAFHGAATWNIQNSTLDAYDFSDKDQDPVNPRPWRNVNNYTLSAGGPIIRHKTFFFISWDHQISKIRTTVDAQVLSPCARKGIYRYLTTANPKTGVIEGIRVNNAAADPTLASGTTLDIPSVNAYTGQPLTSYQVPDDPLRFGIYSGQNVPLATQYMSVLGPLTDGELTQLANVPDCANYNMPAVGTPANAWDDYRYQVDQSGFVSRFTELMPMPNSWQAGDGLNLANYRWTRASSGAATIFGGNLYDDNRKAITVKVDHSDNGMHRVSGTYSYETNNGEDSEAVWPRQYGGYGGVITRKPATFTMMIASTLKPTLLNEFRVGLSRTATMTYDPLNNPDTGKKLALVMKNLLPASASSFPRYTDEVILAGPGYGNTLFHPEGGLNSQPYGSRANIPTTWGGSDPRWTIRDTITWMRGEHSFKSGFEFRYNKSWQQTKGLPSFAHGGNTYPSVKGGVMGAYSPFRPDALSGDPTRTGRTAILYPGPADTDYSLSSTESGNYAGAYGLMGYMTGSVGDISQFFYVTDANNPRWNNMGAGERNYISNLRNQEFSFFFKDDWRINDGLTLNLGVRWEYYGVPWMNSGLGAGVKDGLRGMFGASGEDFTTWMSAHPTQSNYRTEQIFIGPNSLNPDISAFNKDRNNFAPHIGFAWQLPWFHPWFYQRTTLRGGYSISYAPIANFDSTSGYSAVLAHQDGFQTYTYDYTGSSDCLGVDQGCYLDFANVGSILPLYDTARGYMGMANQPIITGGPQQAITKRDRSLTIFDPNIRNPYTQNLTLALTRNIGYTLMVDVRYIGTLSRKATGMLDLNTVNFINNGLIDELVAIRNGSNNPDDYPQLAAYVRPHTLFPANDAGAQIRGAFGGYFDRNTHTMTGLSAGNLSGVAQQLATANFSPYVIPPTGTHGADPGIVSAPADVKGQVLRYGGAPETLIYANPQYASANIIRNQNHSNYHSMQVRLETCQTYALNYQVTYTWSRNLTDNAVTDYNNWGHDYWLASSHRSHQLNVNGMYRLPFGEKSLFSRDDTSIFEKAIEGWRIGWIAQITSGIPMSISGTNTLWANGALDLVRPDLWDNKSGHVEWASGANDGSYYGNRYMRVPDPQCSAISPDLNFWCQSVIGMSALAVIDHYDMAGNPVAGPIVFQNAQPGQRGNFQGNNLTGPSRWSLDMNMNKSVELIGSRNMEFRVDAQNIFNHATPAYGAFAWGSRTNQAFNPNMAVNTTSSDPFGMVNTKTGHRTFQVKIRIIF